MAHRNLEIWLDASRVIRPAGDIAAMNRAELLATFGSARTGRLMVTRLVKALVYRSWRRIQDGADEEIQGNVRTFWYREVKPILSRVPEQLWSRQDPDRAVSEVLASLIEGKHLLSYADFGFTDENWRNRGIGLLRPHVLLFAEKAGQLRLLLRLHKALGVSFLALGGLPSACTSEFTARQLQAGIAATALPAATPVHLVGIVDHDPWGALIAASFVRQLRSFGLEVAATELLVTPDAYTADEMAAHRIPEDETPRTAAWLADGGGIDGQPFGLSVESMPTSRLQARATRAIKRLAPRRAPPSNRGVPTGDPRWQAAVAGPGGRDAVVVLRPDQMGLGAMALLKSGFRLVVLEDGAIVSVLG